MRDLTTQRTAIVFKQGTIPASTDFPQFQANPGDLWSDISFSPPVPKICTVQDPLTFIAITGGGGGASTADQFVTWASAADLSNQKVIGTFLTSVLQTALPFARGGTVLTPTAPLNVEVWRAPFACTVTAVKGYTADATGTTINARKNGSLTHLSADLTINAAGSWIDGGAVQNTAYAIGDNLQIMLTGIGGSPTQIAIQIDFTRP